MPRISPGVSVEVQRTRCSETPHSRPDGAGLELYDLTRTAAASGRDWRPGGYNEAHGRSITGVC